MAKQRLKSPRVRLFVALDIPEEIRDGLVRWGRRNLESDRALRPVRPESLHLTLVFIGYRPEREVDPIGELVTGAAPGAPRIRLLAEPVPVPRRRPRLFAVAAESPDSVSVQAELSSRLQAARLYRPEKRRFWPHLTVARVRRESRGSRRPATVDGPPAGLPAPLLEPFSAVRLSLYRSILRPEGAEYVRLANVELPPAGG